jgi:hypothetical protein
MPSFQPIAAERTSGLLRALPLALVQEKGKTRPRSCPIRSLTPSVSWRARPCRPWCVRKSTIFGWYAAAVCRVTLGDSGVAVALVPVVVIIGPWPLAIRVLGVCLADLSSFWPAVVIATTVAVVRLHAAAGRIIRPTVIGAVSACGVYGCHKSARKRQQRPGCEAGIANGLVHDCLLVVAHCGLDEQILERPHCLGSVLPTHWRRVKSRQPAAEPAWFQVVRFIQLTQLDAAITDRPGGATRVHPLLLPRPRHAFAVPDPATGV